MLVAYYSKGCNSQELFDSLKINQSDTYPKHLNQHHVIYFNIQNFLNISSSVNDMLFLPSKEVIDKLEDMFSVHKSRKILSLYLATIYAKTSTGFIFIIDE